MRFSVSHLLIVTLFLAMVLGIGYPALKFVFYDNVNFTYDRDQTIEYVKATTSGHLRQSLLEATDQLSVWDNERILVVDASLTNNVIHVELITTSFHQPESLNIELDSGETVSVESYEIESTGTYYFYGDIPVNHIVSDAAKIMSIRFSNGESQSNVYALSTSRRGG